MSTFDWVMAADTANMQAGGTSFFDKTTDFLTKGVGGAVVSGIHAMANTGIDFSNKVFGTDAERYDTARTLQDFDSNWAQYYKENQSLVDTTGLFLGSLVPGMLAVKGLRMAVGAGESAGAFSRVLGFASKEKASLQAALTELSAEGGTVFSSLNKNKLAAMAWGTAQQALEAAAYETATVITMKSSPILENTEWKDVAWDVAHTALAGGILGGGINALFTNKIVRDAGTAVAKKQRMYDVMTTLDKTNLSFGDKAFAVQDAIASLPKEALEAMTQIPFKHAKNGVLDTSALMNATLRGTVDRGYLRLQTTLVEAANGDKTVGSALAEGILGIVKEHQAAKLPSEALNSKLGEFLWNLRQADGIGARPHTVEGSIEYVNPKGNFTQGTVFSATPLPGYKPYRLIGDASLENTRIFTLGKDAKTFEEAVAAGADAVIDPATGTFRVSPKSGVFQELKNGEDQLVSMFLNTRTMQTASDVVPTIADVATLQNPLKIELGGVLSGNKSFSFKSTGFNSEAARLELTARYAWASQPGLKLGGTVAGNDFALLDAFIQTSDRAAPGTTVFDTTTKLTRSWSEIANPGVFVFKQKFEQAVKLLEAAGEKGDLRDIALKLNVEPSWLQKAVDSQFSQKELFADRQGWSRPLDSYARRENVLLHYDPSKLEGAADKARGVVAYAQRVSMAAEVNAGASAAVLGAKWSKLLPSLGQDFSRTMDQQNVGPSMLGASNAGYEDNLRRNAQYIGTIVAQASTEAVNATSLTLMSAGSKLLSSPQASAEAVAAITKLRLSPDNFSLFTNNRTGQISLVDTPSFKRALKTGRQNFEEIIPLSPEVGEFFSAHQGLHATRVDKQGVLQTAAGLEKRWDPDVFYAPPVDTRRIAYFAWVKEPTGKLFASSDVAMLTARTAQELEKKAASLRADGFDVIYKRGTEDWFKAQASFDFSRTMNAPELDSFLRKQGKLGDMLPNMSPQALVEDFMQYTQRAETKLVRDAVSAKYAQQVAELEDLSLRYTQAQQSRFLGFDKWQKDQDPFRDTINLMLNVSKKGEYALWHQANEFVDAVGTRAYRGIDAAHQSAREGKLSWEEANTALDRMGLGRPYKDAEQFIEAQHGGDRNLIKTALNKANMLLVNGTLRLDTANSLLNVLSTPILLGGEISALRKIMSTDPELSARFAELTSSRVPGTQEAVPSALKLMHEAVRNYFGPDRATNLLRYQEIGAVRNGTQLFHDMLEDLAIQPKMLPKEWSAKVDKWTEFGAKWSGSERAEEFTRFVSANVMHQVTEPMVAKGLMSVAEQNSWISTFVNKVQGNYVAAQRPILFQGTLGSAIGLFQTYQFNMFQQLFRHIENKDARSLAVIGGLQSSLYGLHGLPFFDAVNTQILGGAKSNPDHRDIYTGAVQAFGKEAGDWLMYGTASAMPLFSEQAPALWSRGDLNPRQLSVVPVNPMDVPAVQASIKAVAAVMGVAQQLGGGAGLKDALLFGLEHNGLNRPLAGLAIAMKGNATTSQGDLISASNDLFSIANGARLLGARPMDESIALNTVYTSRAYQAMDKQKLDKLGIVVKNKLRSGDQINEEDWTDLMGKYAASGGRIEGFQQAIKRWDKSAHTSLTAEVMKHSQTNSGRRMILLLGGEPLESQAAPEGQSK